MNHLVVKNFGGEEAFRYEQLCSICFHDLVPGLLDKEQSIKNLVEQDAAWGNDKTEVYGNSFTRTGVFKDERLIAAAKNYAFVVNFDGHKCEMDGIGGVLCDPEMRNMGAITCLYRQMFVDMKKKGQILSHLYPFKLAFYRKYGYESCTSRALWTIPTEYLPKRKYSGMLHYENTEEQKHAIKKVYNEFIQAYNLAVVKSEEKWKAYFKSHIAYGSEYYSYLHYSKGAADGFLSYKVEKQSTEPMTIYVENIYFSNANALGEMLAFLGSFRAYAKQVKIPVPEDIDFICMLDEICGGYGTKDIKKEIIPMGATRVVDVEEILKMARYQGEGSVDIKIHDSFCPWNDKCFHLEFDHVCTRVSEGTGCDAEMDINAFSALILGRHRFENYTYMEHVKVYENMENLKKVFYKKSMWLEEGF